jgi:hypothetical protein
LSLFERFLLDSVNVSERPSVATALDDLVIGDGLRVALQGLDAGVLVEMPQEGHCSVSWTSAIIGFPRNSDATVGWICCTIFLRSLHFHPHRLP